MIVSNKSITMTSIDQYVNQTPTRLKIQRYPSLYTLAFVATSLQVQGNETELKSQYTKLSTDFTYSPLTSIKPSGTQVSMAQFEVNNYIDTVLWKHGFETLDAEINIKPNYTRKFKVKVMALRIDKTLPKIFLD